MIGFSHEQFAGESKKSYFLPQMNAEKHRCLMICDKHARVPRLSASHFFCSDRLL